MTKLTTLASRVFQNRNLTLLWVGQVLSQSGDSIYQIALLWLVLDLSGSEAVTGFVSLASYLPAVLLSLMAGVAADRSNRRFVLLTADAARFLVVLSVPLLAALKGLTPTTLAINAFCLAIAATFFNPARDALVPQLVPAGGLLRANSLVQSSWQMALLFGPAVAGLLLPLVGIVHLFTVDAALFLFSFCCIAFIRIPPQKRERRPGDALGIREVREGLVYALRHKVIFPLLLITVADNLFIMGPAIVGTPVFIKRELGLGASAYALIQGCYAVGMLLGTLGLLFFGGRWKKGRVLLLGMILDGLTFVPLFWVDTLPQMAAVIVIHSLAIPMLMVVRASLIQSLVPPELTGRIFAMVNLAVVGMSAISSGAAGVFLETFGARSVFLWIGIGGGLCGVVGWLFAKHLLSAD